MVKLVCKYLSMPKVKNVPSGPHLDPTPAPPPSLSEADVADAIPTIMFPKVMSPPKKSPHLIAKATAAAISQELEEEEAPSVCACCSSSTSFSFTFRPPFV